MNSTAAQISRSERRAFPPLACQIEGRGPNLVLLHGGTGSWTHWARTIPALSDRFHIFAFDLPGCGDSPDFPVTWSDEDYFQWVADEILSRCDGPVLLTGFSFGGSVAAAVAPLLGDRLRALCLVAPGSFGEPVLRNVDVRPMRVRAGIAVDERANARHNLGEVMFADIESADEAAIDLQIANVRRARFASRRISWQDRIVTDLASVRCPVHLIWGSRDRMATPSPVARATQVQATRPDVGVTLIEGGGHWVQHERATDFNFALRSFLEPIAGGGAQA